MWEGALKCLLRFLLRSGATEGWKFISTAGALRWPRTGRAPVYNFNLLPGSRVQGARSPLTRPALGTNTFFLVWQIHFVPPPHPWLRRVGVGSGWILFRIVIFLKCQLDPGENRRRVPSGLSQQQPADPLPRPTQSRGAAGSQCGSCWKRPCLARPRYRQAPPSTEGFTLQPFPLCSHLLPSACILGGAAHSAGTWQSLLFLLITALPLLAEDDKLAWDPGPEPSCSGMVSAQRL